MVIHPKAFYMVRHGQTVANVGQIMAGSLDSPLTEDGRKQAQIVADLFKHIPEKPGVIIHSHKSRARDTAAIINTTLNLPMMEDPEITEFDAGIWEGKPYETCRDFLHGWMDAPGGEKATDFLERVRRAKNRILKMETALPLIVTHGGVFRAFGKLYGRAVAGVQNCELHIFEPDAKMGHDFPWAVHRLLPDSAQRYKKSRASYYY